MFLKDISIGFPGGYKYRDPDLNKLFSKNHYSALLIAVSKERMRHTLPVEGLEEKIQTYLCDNCNPDVREQYCADASTPKVFKQKSRPCGSCGKKK